MHVLVIRPATLTVSPAISTSATAEVNRRSINATGRVRVSNFVSQQKLCTVPVPCDKVTVEPESVTSLSMALMVTAPVDWIVDAPFTAVTDTELSNEAVISNKTDGMLQRRVLWLNVLAQHLEALASRDTNVTGAAGERDGLVHPNTPTHARA